jgi:hypothetical protein
VLNPRPSTKTGTSEEVDPSSRSPIWTVAEKEDDAKARAAIKLQIEADKKARAERTALEKSIRDGGVIDVGTGRAANVAKPAAATGAGGAGKDYPETRLQVRRLSAALLPLSRRC